MRIWLFILLMVGTLTASAQNAKVLFRYPVPQSRQGVAVDHKHFYVINNGSITKHEKSNGQKVDDWIDTKAIFKHLNSGIVIDNKLICTNSNYPESPMASSIEIFDPTSLRHIASHSFGIAYGSATWIDLYDDHWYVAFAHYTGQGASMTGMDNSWSRIVKFDKEWQFKESWIFPKELLERFGTRSNSGGFIFNGSIFATGHDNYELYELRIPDRGYTLEWVATHPVGSYGQGISYERKDNTLLIYGIIRSENVVVVSELPLQR